MTGSDRNVQEALHFIRTPIGSTHVLKQHVALILLVSPGLGTMARSTRNLCTRALPIPPSPGRPPGGTQVAVGRLRGHPGGLCSLSGDAHEGSRKHSEGGLATSGCPSAPTSL
jgi:hypothetical protein